MFILFPNKIKAVTRYSSTIDTDTATTPLVLLVVAVATVESWRAAHWRLQ
jgi:hypothetical protein